MQKLGLELLSPNVNILKSPLFSVMGTYNFCSGFRKWKSIPEVYSAFIMSWQQFSILLSVAKNTDFSQPYFQYAFNIYIQAVFDKQGFWISFNEHCVQLHYLQHHGPLKIYPPTVTTNSDTKKGSYSPHSHSLASFTVGKSQSHLYFITHVKEFGSAGQCQREFCLYTCLTYKSCSSLALHLYLSSSKCLHARFTSHKHLVMAKTSFSSRWLCGWPNARQLNTHQNCFLYFLGRQPRKTYGFQNVYHHVYFNIVLAGRWWLKTCFELPVLWNTYLQYISFFFLLW